MATRIQLEKDIASRVGSGVPVILWDRNHLNKDPGTRDQTGAEVIADLVHHDPQALVLVQAGLIHAQKNPTLNIDPMFQVNAKLDQNAPLASRLAQRLGGILVLSVAEDEIAKVGGSYVNTLPDALREVVEHSPVVLKGPRQTYDFVVPISERPFPAGARISGG